MLEAYGARFPDNDKEAGNRLIALGFAIDKVTTFLSENDQVTWDSIAREVGWETNRSEAEKTLNDEFVFYLDHSEISSSKFTYLLSLKHQRSNAVLLKIFAVAKQFLYSGGGDGGSLSSEAHPFSDN